MIKNIFKIFAITLTIILFSSSKLFAVYSCQYLYCDDIFCNKLRCISSGVTCKPGQYGGNVGKSSGSYCCYDQCCGAGYYDCCSTTYGCCCPVSPPPPPCDPKTSCSCSSPLSSSSQGNGSKSVNCPDGCGGTASSTCYCPAGSCAALDPMWLDTQPAPPFRSYTLTVPVTNTVSGCPTTDQKTCYTTNQAPQLESIEILPIDEGSPAASLPSSIKKLFSKIVNIANAQTFTENIMGYTSDFSSGKELNNPIQLVATYSDADGSDDIEAVYVWWSPESQIGLEESTDYLYPTSETGLRRYYPMDEASGTTVKDVAGNTSGTASGTTITSGKSNNARSFDGSNDYINTGEDIDYGTGTQITVSAWIKYTSCTGADGLCYVVTKNQYNGATPYNLFVKTGGVVGFSVQGNGAFSGTGYDDGNWHYITGILNGTTSEVYVDGELKGSNTVTPISNNQDIIIGGDDAGPTYRPFNGTIDEVSIYNVALTESQILEKYELGYAEVDTTAITPNKIDTTKDPQTDKTSSFGFMVTKDGTVYSPHITSADDRVWTEPQYEEIDGIGYYYVSGPSKNSMIGLSDISISELGSNQVKLVASMSFLNSGSHEEVSTQDYNLFGMANDYAGFTEFETEEGAIKDDNIWEDSGTDWLLDMEDPGIVDISKSTNSDEEDPKVRLSFTAKDNYQLSYVRVDACYSGSNDPKELIAADGSSGYTMQECDNMTTYFEDVLNVKSTRDLISFSSDPEVVGKKEENYDIEIGIDGNNNGSVTFYITAMDMAGNYRQETVIFKLGDWAVVEDGFIFGNSGVTSATSVLENDWDSNSEIKDSNYTNSTYDTVDLTNNVLLGGSASDIGFLGILEKYDVNNSFKASNFPGAPINAVYSELAMAYELKKRNISYIEEESGTLNGTLSSYCNSGEPYDFCIIKNSGDISINSNGLGFECDTKGLIISGNDVNINPDMINSSTSSDSACIILAKNDINIDQGSSKSDAEVNYDIIQAFMIAGNDINIDSDGSNNGLLVEGGLLGFGTENGTSILNNRSILWGYRNQYPIIIVNNNGKYGLLSKDVFGSQVEIFKLEIGFKPY